jgi:hypothetical protein
MDDGNKGPESRIALIARNHGTEAHGRNELIRYLERGKLTLRDAVLAKCYECCGYYADGKSDCKMADCPLYGFMPYRAAGKSAMRV